ncbi:response regulator [Paenibacillus hexagrammi]|uniref:Response regulator n=1 Tax=Paenibacillus hexagrammi TaxID=2908839 RepID=A0ABY3SJ49_9BACL|nr:response regulator [Paenibacillus sp. YPD9-1]UJF34064.1 response regulator [Paenibacillus sp. YPD9-1]
MKPTILIVDDATSLRGMIKQMLTSLGFHVLEASNGAEAIESYQTYKPDLITMDLYMPEMNGMDALKKIKEFDPSAKVVMCSSYANSTTMIEAIHAGAKDFVLKPFRETSLLETIKKQLAL